MDNEITTESSNTPIKEKTIPQTLDILISKIEILEHKLSVFNLNRKEFLNAKETSIYFNISVAHLYSLAKQKLVPFYKPNRKTIYFKIDEIEDWIKNSRQKSYDNIEEESDKRTCILNNGR